MLSEDIKAVICAVLAGSIFWLGWHCNGVVQDDKAKTLALAQAQIVQTQESKNVALLQQQQAAKDSAQAAFDKQHAADLASNANLNALLLRVEAQLSAGTVPSIPGAPGSGIGSSGGSSSFGGFNQAVATSLTACRNDSTKLQLWQDWYAGIKP